MYHDHDTHDVHHDDIRTAPCWPSPSNQSFYRQVASCWRSVGDPRVGQ